MAPTPNQNIPTTQTLLPAEQAPPPDLARRAQELAAQTQLDPKRPESVSTLGAASQQKAAQVAEKLLAKVDVKDAGGAGQLLATLTTQLRSVDPKNLRESTLEKATHLPLVGRLVRAAVGTATGYHKTLEEMDLVKTKLETARTTILGDVNFLSELYEQNLLSYKDLLVWIEVCKMKLAELDNDLLPAAKAKAVGDPIAAQSYADLQSHRQRLDKRRTDLEITRTLRIQAAPKIRLIQAGDVQLAENLQSSIINGIPLFKENLALAITMGRQAEAAKVQGDFSDSLNQMISQGADMLHDNAVTIATQSQRGVVDLETLQHSQEQLLASITDVQRIMSQGEANRENTRKALDVMEDQLKEKLVA